MSSSEIKPDVVSFNTVINSHAKNDDPVSAMSWLRNLEAANLVPNIVSYNTVVGAYARVGDPYTVADVLEEMTSVSLDPNVVTWTSMLTACANAAPRRISAAERVFAQMRECGVKPNQATMKALRRAVGGARFAELCPKEFSDARRTPSG